MANNYRDRSHGRDSGGKSGNPAGGFAAIALRRAKGERKVSARMRNVSSDKKKPHHRSDRIPGSDWRLWRRERDSNPRWSFTPHTRLAGERLQPTRPSLRIFGMAEGVGFEPTAPLLTGQRFSRPPPSTTRPSLQTRFWVQNGLEKYHRLEPLSSPVFPGETARFCNFRF